MPEDVEGHLEGRGRDLDVRRPAAKPLVIGDRRGEHGPVDLGKERGLRLGDLGGWVSMSQARALRYAPMKRLAVSVPSHSRVAARLENAHGPIASPTEATTWPTPSCSSCCGAGPC